MLRWWLNDTTVSTFSGMSGAGTELTESTLGVASKFELLGILISLLVENRSETWNGGQGFELSTPKIT
jgi:hypothetical protein